MNTPKLILFDIGGVLIDYSAAFSTAALELGIPIEAIYQPFDKYDDQVTLGQMSPQELYLACLQENNLNADPDYTPLS